MGQLKPVKPYERGVAVGGGLGAIVWGSLWASGGLSTLIWSVKSDEGNSIFLFLFIVFFGLAFGFLLIGSGLFSIRRALRFEAAGASISEAQVRPGQRFRFSFRQKLPREVQAIRVFLVFREKAEYDYRLGMMTHRHHANVDGLVQQEVIAERAYRAGEVVEFACTLQMPEKAKRNRNSFMEWENTLVEAMWVVKVRLDLDGENSSWEEFVLPSEPIGDGSYESWSPEEGLWDVYLYGPRSGNELEIHEVLASLLPHLDRSQISSMTFRNDWLVCQDVEEEQALEAKARLEAAGAMVVVNPSGEAESNVDGMV